MAVLKNVKSYCHNCGHDTHHTILFSEKIVSGDTEYFWQQSYCVVKCCGCEELSFLRITEEEGCMDDDGNIVLQYETYPYTKDEVEPVEAYYVPCSIRKVYEETIKAMNNGCSILAAAGFRATIESICKDKEITGKTLEQRINNLQKRGIITLQDRDRLHTIRFLGNDSIHVMKTPSRSDMYLLLEIVNNTLNNLYILDEKTEMMEKPVSNFLDFVDILEVQLSSHKSGEVLTLDEILQKERRVMKEDKDRFEAELIDMIKKGHYSRLVLDAQTPVGKPQQYIVSLNMKGRYEDTDTEAGEMGRF